MIRVGIGYDSHRFAPGGPCILGGVAIPGDRHLAGHSDGDAVAHAITDAVLGAAALGDIGTLFPDSDPANKGRDSLAMLRSAVARAADAGWFVQQADVAIIAEWPRVAAHRARMQSLLGAALGLSQPAQTLSIKGKSNEGMGWIGRQEGLACIAVVTLVSA